MILKKLIQLIVIIIKMNTDDFDLLLKNKKEINNSPEKNKKNKNK